MDKLEAFLRNFLILVFGCLLCIDLAGGYWLVFAPYWNQVQYDNDNRGPLRFNAIAGALTYDCGQLDTATQQATIRTLDDDIIVLTARVDLSKVGMPLSTRTCVINVIHEHGKNTRPTDD
jgi:hypothetical protein